MRETGEAGEPYIVGDRWFPSSSFDRIRSEIEVRSNGGIDPDNARAMVWTQTTQVRTDGRGIAPLSMDPRSAWRTRGAGICRPSTLVRYPDDEANGSRGAGGCAT